MGTGEKRVPIQETEGSYSQGECNLQRPTTHALSLPTRSHCSVSAVTKVLPQVEDKHSTHEPKVKVKIQTTISANTSSNVIFNFVSKRQFHSPRHQNLCSQLIVKKHEDKKTEQRTDRQHAGKFSMSLPLDTLSLVPADALPEKALSCVGPSSQLLERLGQVIIAHFKFLTQTLGSMSSVLSSLPLLHSNCSKHSLPITVLTAFL